MLPSSMTEELMFLDDPFHLNADSIFFLDKIFMGYPDPSASGPAWPNPSSETQPLVFTQSVLSTMPPEGQSFGTNTLNQQSQPSYMSQTLPPRLQGQQQQLQQQAQQDQQPQQQQSSTATAFKPSTQLKDGGYDPPPWTRCGLDEDTFVNALKAYFSHVTLYLPILLEDAFCQDYNTGRCSLSIIYAVACRGLPFTCPSADKTEMWAQQQRVAEQFREAFFAAQLGANNNRGRVRLDDLEALALMVYFKYNDAASASSDTPASSSATALTQLHAHLTSLYLTHDSLVLMTMQSGIDTPDAVNNASATSASATATDPKAPLARLNDRRILLFWHVYGLDAFHCLDKKLISRIPDCNHHMLLPVTGAASGGSTASPIKKNLPCHSKEAATARGYLDAILDLAILARQALISLSNATARRRGVRAEDLETVYGLLEQWQRVGCPPHLRRQRDPVTKKLSLTAGLDSNSNTHIVQLHRAVVWILEINCYLQIEDCVCEYGIYEPTSSSSTTPMIPTLDTEALALRYEAETVCRLRDGVEIARSMLAYKPDSNGHNATRQGQYALADLGKSIIRDCCYGLAQWACLRGSQQLRRALPSMMEARRPRAEIEGATAALSDRQRQRISSYIEAAKVLRDAVATAVSHADTEPAVNTLNGMISSLKTQMEEMSATG
ncbi:hypothetical protein SBRCBS47491_005011 [Sporothrix bragantina]|uniref:Transcription factor domain-containing protein n=1 Tax=Sporothrix bragantina TaxID=671064 RepID=A0ABP0BTX2_9PEZI